MQILDDHRKPGTFQAVMSQGLVKTFQAHLGICWIAVVQMPELCALEVRGKGDCPFGPDPETVLPPCMSVQPTPQYASGGHYIIP